VVPGLGHHARPAAVGRGTSPATTSGSATRLGLLTRSVEEELAVDTVERQAWLDELRRVGLLPADGADVEGTVQALHAYLARTPSRLRCVALTDAVGDRRTQNQPGTIDEYPNWRVPLSDPDGRPMLLEDVFSSERAARLCAVLSAHRARDRRERAFHRPAAPTGRLLSVDVAEGDAAAAGARGRVAEDDLVAVLEERTARRPSAPSHPS
jgi:hypothetical protein